MSGRHAVASSQDDESTGELAGQKALSSQEQYQHSSSLSHITQHSLLAGQHAPLDFATTLAEGTRLLLNSVQAASSPKQSSFDFPGIDISQEAPLSGVVATQTTSQHRPALKQRLRSTSSSTPVSTPGPIPRPTAAAPTEKAPAATQYSVHSPEAAGLPAKAPQQPTGMAQAATQIVTTLTQTVATATQTRNSLKRLGTPESALWVAYASDTKQHKPILTATKSTQTEPEKPAAVTLGTQIHGVCMGLHDVNCIVQQQPQAMMDAAQTLSSLIEATAPQSPRPFSTPASPTLASPKTKGHEVAPHMTPGRSRQLHLSPDARDRAPIRSLRAQRVNSKQHDAPTSLRTNVAASHTRPFRGRSVQPDLHERSTKPAAAATPQCSTVPSTGTFLPITPQTAGGAAPVVTPPSADVSPLLADIMGTAGCRVTRRLVHSVMAAETGTGNPATLVTDTAKTSGTAAPQPKRRGRPPRQAANQHEPAKDRISMQTPASNAQATFSAKREEALASGKSALPTEATSTRGTSNAWHCFLLNRQQTLLLLQGPKALQGALLLTQS